MHKLCFQKLQRNGKPAMCIGRQRPICVNKKDLIWSRWICIGANMYCMHLHAHIMQLARQSARGLGERIDGWLFRNRRRKREANPTSYPVTGQTKIA